MLLFDYYCINCVRIITYIYSLFRHMYIYICIYILLDLIRPLICTKYRTLLHLFPWCNSLYESSSFTSFSCRAILVGDLGWTLDIQTCAISFLCWTCLYFIHSKASIYLYISSTPLVFSSSYTYWYQVLGFLIYL